jgi:glycosyltransferase involved in cell wall biosynthesis
MIKVAELLGQEYIFDIMGTATEYNNEYFQKLLNMSSNISNVSFIKPVSFKEIIPTINKYDIGIYILNPNGFNNEYALPNKIFEYVQAKLAIAISPSKEMRHIVEKYDLGVVADDFSPESLAKKIKELSKDDIFRFKQNSEIASKVENAEKYSELYLSHIKMLLNESFLFQ